MATKQQKQDLIQTLKFTPRTYNIYIGGYGGESYAGRVSRVVYDYFKENRIDIEEYAADWDDKFNDVPRDLQPFSPGSPYDCDGLFHASGAELTNLNEIQINDENGNQHWACAAGLNELEDAGVTVNQGSGYDFEDAEFDDHVIFWGGQGEKGTFFDGELHLKEPFDPKKLCVSYENCDGWWLISSVEYDGEEVDGSGGYSTTGKWTENKWILPDGEEHYSSISREDQDEEEEDEEESEWCQPHETGTDNPIDFPESACTSETWDPVAELDKIIAPLQVTDWFPAHVNPVRKGIYEVMVGPVAAWPFPNQAHYTWTGKVWKDVNGNKATIHQWRGVTEDLS